MDKLTPQHRSWLMSRIRSKNTSPELAVRRMVFRMGYRYRLHGKQLPGKPDLVFAGRRKVVFVNGCFWHGHEGCRYARLPKTRIVFWRAKRKMNRARDRANIALLEKSGWKVLTVWQCELKDPQALLSKLYDFIEHA